MFLDSSKFLRQSQSRVGGGDRTTSAPLFQEEDEQSGGGSLYSSRYQQQVDRNNNTTSKKKGGWVSSFAGRNQASESQLLQYSRRLDDYGKESEGGDEDEPSSSLLQEHTKGGSSLTSSSEGEMESIGLHNTRKPGSSNVPESDQEDEEDEEEEEEEDGPPADITTQQQQQRQQEQQSAGNFLPPEIPLGGTNQQAPLDTLWSTLYLLSVSMLFATALIVWLRTSVPKSVPLGDTIYTMMKSSWSTIILTTTFSIVLSTLWILFMKRYAKGLIYFSFVSVPIILIAFTIYPMLMSYRSGYGGNTSQDQVMRWTSLIPLLLAALWIVLIYRGRYVLQRSLNAVELCCTIVSDNKPLLLVGSATVFVFIIFTFIWIGLFTRVFLRGKVVNGSSWVLDGKSWVLGAFYVFVYLWTWGVISGIQRAVVAATVSQWYFHRHDIPQLSPLTIVKAAVIHSTTVQFGTICYSSFVCLIARLPMLLLPRLRLISWSPIQLIFFTLIPGGGAANVSRLTSPLSLTSAVIKSRGLVETTGSNNLLHSNDSAANISVYKLSKVLLTTARGLTTIAMGFAAWTHAAKYTNGGSLYGYVVGLIAGFIGWFVLAGTEGTLSMILDALSVSYAIDYSLDANNTHCMEAQRIFS